MRAVGIIIAGVVAVIAVIVIQFYRSPGRYEPDVADFAGVPEPSQMTRAEYTSALISLLEQSDPDVWHQVAMGWNWDGGVAPLVWMIRQPQCDRATALLIYWRGGPGSFLEYSGRDEVPAFALEVFDLLAEVEDRLLSDFYARQEIAFDPRSDDNYDWTTRYADRPAKRHIAEQLHEGVSGRTLSPCVYLSTGLRC